MTRPGAADLALIALALTALAARSDAQPAAPSTDIDLRAAELFDLGVERRNAGDLNGACAAFAESQELDPSLGTSLNLAPCLERDGRIEAARALLRATIDEAERQGDRVRATRARSELLALEARVAAGSPGRERDPMRDRDIASSDVRDRDDPRPADGRPVRPRRTSADREAGRVPGGATARRSRVPLLLGIGAGALGAVGATLVFSGHGQQDAADAACPDIGQIGCDAARAQSLNDSAVLRSRIGVGMLIGGAVIAEAAVYLWWRGRERAPQTGLVVTPGGGMVTYQGSFR